ncbi:E3 ubiquitin-protein ligase TRIM17-like [Arapaima gigas]
MASGNCSACRKALTDQLQLACGHRYCLSCMTDKWGRGQRCPLCRPASATVENQLHNTGLWLPHPRHGCEVGAQVQAHRAQSRREETYVTPWASAMAWGPGGSREDLGRREGCHSQDHGEHNIYGDVEVQK